jgi:hypothetical protein
MENLQITFAEYVAGPIYRQALEGIARFGLAILRLD